MTEAEWFACDDPVRMLRAWRAEISDPGEQWYSITATERSLYMESFSQPSESWVTMCSPDEKKSPFEALVSLSTPHPSW